MGATFPVFSQDTRFHGHWRSRSDQTLVVHIIITTWHVNHIITMNIIYSLSYFRFQFKSYTNKRTYNRNKLAPRVCSQRFLVSVEQRALLNKPKPKLIFHFLHSFLCFVPLSESVSIPRKCGDSNTSGFCGDRPATRSPWMACLFSRSFHRSCNQHPNCLFGRLGGCILLSPSQWEMASKWRAE